MEKSNIKKHGGSPVNPRRWNEIAGRRTAIQAPALLLLVIAAMLAFRCGGIDEKLASTREPYMKPHEWWSGLHQGRRIILDRNRNIMQTALVKRDCKAADVTRGSCTESIEYQYRKSKKEKFPRESNRLEWTIAYKDNTRMTVEIKDDGGQARGGVTGTVMLLEGRRRIPLQKKRSAAVRIRYDRLPGPGAPVLETRTFTMLGLTIGVVETYWTRLPAAAP